MLVFGGVDGLLVGWRRIMLPQNQLWQRSTIKWLSTKQNHWVHTYIHQMPHQQGDNSKDIETQMIERCANCANNNGTFPKAKHIFLYQTWLPCVLEGCFGCLLYTSFIRSPNKKIGNFIHSSGLKCIGISFRPRGPNVHTLFLQQKQLKIHNSYRKKQPSKTPMIFLWALSIIYSPQLLR